MHCNPTCAVGSEDLNFEANVHRSHDCYIETLNKLVGPQDFILTNQSTYQNYHFPQGLPRLLPLIPPCDNNYHSFQNLQHSTHRPMHFSQIPTPSCITFPSHRTHTPSIPTLNLHDPKSTAVIPSAHLTTPSNYSPHQGKKDNIPFLLRNIFAMP
ncbi:hypothetical protein L211DRAFT_570692 [Terfezia boudieri ATCC MYA-4762]|uniref:Uncharacterized protein n=1 Tax=Terfezia boudieri ATCC MYA-4762 TaxID=1051890 RepID=A0A3N4LBT8_9PEZI|nr:hypothetical protein L211DRAFT_570692 [Terfezia boudieri ATCC MYA-4762]